MKDPCNNFARISLPFASFDILCSWGRGRNIGFHFLKVTTFNISIWGEIWIFHETEAFTKSVRNCRTAHFKTHPAKSRHVQKTYKSTYKSTYKPINNQPINPPLNLHNSKQWILQSLSQIMAFGGCILNSPTMSVLSNCYSVSDCSRPEWIWGAGALTGNILLNIIHEL